MQLTQTHDIAGRSVAIKELTVGEIRQWLKSLESGGASLDVVGSTLFEELTFDDLVRFTDLDRASLDAWKPSELRQLIDKIKAVNADFFLLRSRLVVLGQALAQHGSASN